MSDLAERGAAAWRWSALLACGLALGWGAAWGVLPALAWGLGLAAALLACWLYPRLALRALRVARDLPPGACEDDAVAVRFTVTNAGALPLLAPEVEDAFAPDKVPHRRATVWPRLPAWAAAEAAYVGHCHGRRGVHAIGPARARLTCPLGLFSAAREVAPARALVVYPAVEALGPLPESGATRVPALGGAASRAAGDGGLALGVRDHRPGDPLRRVHWPTTARRGRLTVVEHERQVARGVVVVLDLARASLRGLGRHATLEVAVHLAAAVAARTLLQGDRVALHGLGREALELPLAGGRAQLDRALDALARVRPDGEVPLGEVARARVARLLPGQLAWLVVADLAGDLPACLDVAAAARARGARLACALLDPRAFPRLFGAPQEEASVDAAAAALTAEGALAYPVRPGQALTDALAAPWAGRRALRLTREMLA